MLFVKMGWSWLETGRRTRSEIVDHRGYGLGGQQHTSEEGSWR